jgi:hypothetical protein
MGSGLKSVPFRKLLNSIGNVFVAAMPAKLQIAAKIVPLSAIEDSWGAPNRQLGFLQKGPPRLALAYTCVYASARRSMAMTTLKVGVREFRDRIASFLESDTPVAVTRRGETLGVYVPTRRQHRKAAELSELKAAADRLAAALVDVDEEELVAEFKQSRRRKKDSGL